MACRRAEVPHDRLFVLHQKAEARQFVHCPGANVRSCDVANIVHIEAEQRAQLRMLEKFLNARQAFVAQTFKVNALFPIDSHQTVCSDSHNTHPFDPVCVVRWQNLCCPDTWASEPREYIPHSAVILRWILNMLCATLYAPAQRLSLFYHSGRGRHGQVLQGWR